MKHLDAESEALRSARAELNRARERIQTQARYTGVLEDKLREAMEGAGLVSITVEIFDPLPPRNSGVPPSAVPRGDEGATPADASRAVTAARIATDNSWWPRREETDRRPLVPNAGWKNYALHGHVEKVVGVSVCGLPRERMEAIVSMIADQQTKFRDFVPVFLTDSNDFSVFRRFGFVFEYFPSMAKRSGSGGAKSWADYGAERRALIERKWGLAHIIRFGPHEFASQAEMRPDADRIISPSGEAPSRLKLDLWYLSDRVSRDPAPAGDPPDSGAGALRAADSANLARPKKLVLGVTTYNRLTYLEQCVRSWIETRNTKYHWVVIIADDGSTDGTLNYLEQLTLPHELHIIRNERRYACGQTNTIYELAQRIGFDIGFKVDDDVMFKKRGWDDLYVNAIEESSYQHLCHLNFAHYLRLRRRNDPGFELPMPKRDPSGHCMAVIEVNNCDGSFFTFTPEILRKVGYNDEDNFPIRGQWHIDYSIRCCRAGFNSATRFYDAAGSNEHLDLQANRPEYRCSIPWGPEYKRTKEPTELARRQAVLADATRLYVPYPKPALPRVQRIDDVFEKVIVLNLDRRTDRWARIAAQASRHGIRVERFSAVDGQAGAVNAEWRAYAAKLLAQSRRSERVIRNSREFYLDYDSHAARVAYVERLHGKKAIQTPGAWAYLRSMIGVLEKCVEDRLETVLLLDDDAVFHRRINDLFARFIVQAPADWKILQLGALQYHWADTWISWYSDNLYSCNGSSVGSHAVGMHCSVFEILLEHARKFELPYDIGPLHAVKRAHADRCLTMSPNLIIQDATPSDISSSTVLQQEAGKRDNVYRWNLDDFDVPELANGAAGHRAALEPENGAVEAARMIEELAFMRRADRGRR